MCSKELAHIASECSVDNRKIMISRNGRNWLRIHNESSLLHFEYYFWCPFDYCHSSTISVDPYAPDSQCALNRTGVLCGGCPPGLSLAIGSSRCKYCPDNSYVAMIIVFLLIGVALVLFIFIFDLTITRGTINGLLFLC